MKNKQLMTEIKRIREIMGVNILTEGIDDLVKKLLGISDNVSADVASKSKNVGGIDDVVKRITGGGSGTYDDLLDFVGKNTSYSKDVDGLVSFLKSKPELYKEIMQAADNMMRGVADDIFKNSTVTELLGPAVQRDIDGLLKMGLTDRNSEFIQRNLERTYKEIKFHPKYKEGNKDLDNLLELLDARMKAASEYKNPPSGKVEPETPSKVEPGTPINISVDVDGSQVIKIIQDDVPESTRNKAVDELNKKPDADNNKNLDDSISGKGKFSDDNIIKAGIDLKKWKTTMELIQKIVALPFEILVKIAETLRIIKPGVYGGKIALQVGAFVIIAYLGYKVFDWMFLGGDPPVDLSISIDTPDMDCIQNVTGYDDLDDDMFKYAAIKFGCAKTKNAKGNQKIKGFSVDENNNLVVTYPNCEERYAVESGGGNGEMVSSTCGETPEDVGDIF